MNGMLIMLYKNATYRTLDSLEHEELQSVICT